MRKEVCDVFISYKMRDSSSKFVKQIADELEERGISCWYADRDASNLIFADKIPKAIRNCKIFLLILDKESTRSSHVQNEIALFFRRMKEEEGKVALLPIRVESCKIPDRMDYYIAQFEINDYNPTNSESVQNLVDEISKKLKPIKFRRSCWPAILTILLLIALVSASQSHGSLVEFISRFAYIVTTIVVVPLSLLVRFLRWLLTALSS